MKNNTYEKKEPKEHIIDIEKLQKFSDMYYETCEWGCNDRAKCFFANAVYSIVSGNKNFEECEQEFLDYMHENHIS